MSQGVPVRQGIGEGVEVSPVILDVSELLGVMLSLDVGIVGWDPEHRFQSQVQVQTAFTTVFVVINKC